MAITAPSLKQIAAIGGFDYSSKASQPMKDFCDGVASQALTASSYQIANNRIYDSGTLAGAGLAAAGTFNSYFFVADAACTVTSAKIVFSGTPTVQPAASPNDCVFTVFKNGSTVVGTKTYTGNVAAAGTWVALTLSGTPANLNLAAGDTLTFTVVQNGLCRIGTGSGVTAMVAMVPKAT